MTPSDIAGSSCAVAVSFYKLVAERGTWDEDLVKEADMTWKSGTNQGEEMAMLRWWMAAEQGIEVAQNNLAYVLDQGMSSLLVCDQRLSHLSFQIGVFFVSLDSLRCPLRMTLHNSR